MQALLSRADISPMWGKYDPVLNSGIHSPLQVSGLSAWYDTTDLSSLVYDGSNRTSLASDKSGNSAVNVLALNGVPGNYGSFTALTAFGSGDFSVSARVRVGAFSTSPVFVGGANNSFSIRANAADGKLMIYQNGVAQIAISSNPALAVGQSAVVGYTRASGTGQFYVDGSAFDGTFADATNYTVGQSEIGSAGIGTTAPFNGQTTWVRIYSVALGAAAMLADAQGTVQANCVFNEDFSLATKLATSITATTGQTVTINSTGATGARICGARDLYQGTVANQPVLTIGASNLLTFNGTTMFMKSPAFSLPQPVTVYLVGSQVSWTINRLLMDGGAASTMGLYNAVTTPNLKMYAGTDGTAFTEFVLNTPAILSLVYNGATGSIRRNRATPVTSNNGTAAANGFTLGASGAGLTPANITVSEVLIYSGAHDTITQNRIILMLGRKWRIAV